MLTRIRTRDLWLWYHIELHVPTSSIQKFKLIGRDWQFTYIPTPPPVTSLVLRIWQERPRALRKRAMKNSTCSCDDVLIVYLLAAEVHANVLQSHLLANHIVFHCTHRKGISTLMQLCLMSHSGSVICIHGLLMDQRFV